MQLIVGGPFGLRLPVPLPSAGDPWLRSQAQNCED